MADLTEKEASQSVKLVGANASGVELDYVASTSDGELRTILPSNGPHHQPRPSSGNLISGSDASGIMRPVLTDNAGRIITSALTGFGADFTFGDVSSASLTLKNVFRTTYTEQLSNSQMSIRSNSASDALTGTGARQVRIVYMDQNGNGPYQETVNLNGTTWVNTAGSNLCFIEQIEVVSVGSGGVNAGTLELRSRPGGGGVVVGTINAGDLQTFWAHHYVPSGKECNVTGISCSHNGTTVGSGGVFYLQYRPIPVGTSPFLQVSDFVRLYGQSSTFSRVYQSPIKIQGPGYLRLVVVPETSSSVIYRGSIDFFEP